VTSFTVPPTTTFSTPPVSFIHRRSTRKGKEKAVEGGDEGGVVSSEAQVAETPRITMVGLERGPGVEEAQAGKVIWLWRDDDEEHTMLTVCLLSSHDGAHLQFDDRIHTIFHLPDSWEDACLLVTASGNTIFLSHDLSPHELPMERFELSAVAAAGLDLSSGVRWTMVDEDGKWVHLRLKRDEQTVELLKSGCLAGVGKLTGLVVSDQGVISAVGTCRCIHAAPC
jgi:hypothetical protein